MLYFLALVTPDIVLNKNMGNKVSKLYGVGVHDEEINLSRRNIAVLHPHILKFKDLKKLSLNENKLIDLPELPMIEYLNAHHNSISAVPVLPYSIKELDLSFNRLFLTQNPNLNTLVNCTKLVLSGNQLEELPTSFKDCRQIQELHLDENAFTEIPTVICTLANIHTLTMNKNKIKRFPIDIAEMKGLKILNVNNNNISYIPDEFCDLILVELDISSNMVTELPSNIGKLRLKSLDISNNQQLEQVPETFNQLRLDILNISKTKLFQLPDIGEMPLKELVMRENKQLVSLEGIPTSLVKLDCRSCSIKSLPSYFGELALEYLDISHNELRSTGIPESFGSLRYIRRLLASHNYFDLIPLPIFSCPSIVELDLSNNLLIQLPETINYLRNLEKLFLNRNRLSQLPESLGAMPIQILEVRENQIGALPKSFGQLSQLIRMDISHNRITLLPSELANLDVGTLQVDLNLFSFWCWMIIHLLILQLRLLELVLNKYLHI